MHFHGHAYLIAARRTDDDVLEISAELAEEGRRWAGAFSSSYVEQITRKTGSFKRFEVFVSMLQALDVETGRFVDSTGPLAGMS